MRWYETTSRDPGSWAYNWATLSLGDVNTRAWLSRLVVGSEIEDPVVRKFVTQPREKKPRVQRGRSFWGRLWLQDGCFVNDDGEQFHNSVFGHSTMKENNSNLEVCVQISFCVPESTELWLSTWEAVARSVISGRKAERLTALQGIASASLLM